MNTNDNAILTALERLGAQFPWDPIEISINRKPNGETSFTAYMMQNEGRGVRSVLACADTLSEVCSELVQKAGNRNPESLREALVAKLKAQIQNLEKADFSMPPYRPGTLLAPGALKTEIDI